MMQHKVSLELILIEHLYLSGMEMVCGMVWIPQRHTRVQNILECVLKENMITILDSIVNIIEEPYATT